MFCAVCSMCNIWHSSLFKLFLFLKTNTQWHLLQLLSSGTVLLYVFTSATHDLILNLIWKYPPFSCHSLTTFFDLTFISSHIVPPQDSVGIPGQRIIISDESVSSTIGWKGHKASITCPNKTQPPSPSLSFTSQRGRKSSKSHFSSGSEGLNDLFCDLSGWGHSLEFYIP